MNKLLKWEILGKKVIPGVDVLFRRAKLICFLVALSNDWELLRDFLAWPYILAWVIRCDRLHSLKNCNTELISFFFKLRAIKQSPWKNRCMNQIPCQRRGKDEKIRANCKERVTFFCHSKSLSLFYWTHIFEAFYFLSDRLLLSNFNEQL